VNGHTGAAQVGGHDPGHSLGPGPGRPVRNEPGPGHGRGVDGDVDDAAVPGGQHPRRDLAGHQEIAGQVRLDHVAETGRRDLPEALRLGQETRVDGAHADARVVHQHVEAAEPRPRFLHRARHRGFAPHVQADADRAGKFGGDLASPLAGASGQRDAAARGGQGPGHREAKPACPAGHKYSHRIQYDPPGESGACHCRMTPAASRSAICAWSYPISPRISTVCWPSTGETPMSGSAPAEKSSGDRTRRTVCPTASWRVSNRPTAIACSSVTSEVRSLIAECGIPAEVRTVSQCAVDRWLSSLSSSPYRSGRLRLRAVPVTNLGSEVSSGRPRVSLGAIRLVFPSYAARVSQVQAWSGICGGGVWPGRMAENRAVRNSRRSLASMSAVLGSVLVVYHGHSIRRL